MLVSCAAFDDVNGIYNEIKEDIFEMRRTDNNRVYRISLETSMPFGKNYAWTIKRVDGFNDVCIYANTNKDITDTMNVNKCWHSVVGDEPFPIIQQKISSV